jgi:hypothetical protein
MNRPLSPEEIFASYYGGAPPRAVSAPVEQPNYIGEVDAVDMGEIDSPENYIGEVDAVDGGEIDDQAARRRRTSRIR